MKSSDAKYGGRSANPLAALEKRQYVTSKALVRGLKESLDAIKGKIATAKTPAFAESQRQLFAEISAAYAEIAKTTDKYLKAEVSAAAALGGKAAGNDADGHDLVRWDEARCRRYWMYVNPQAGKNLAAVFTDKMAESTVTALRRSVVEVQRRAAIEGMSLKDQHKAILESWNALTGDDSNFQFIDRSGKAWDNARYLQMLSRTTAQRVYRDAYADRLAESGFKLVRITSLGAADCQVCRAWQGVICTIAGTQGNLPTIDQAREAGVWHPNCMCSMEYVDEELDADDIEAQEKTDAVDWEDGDAVQERTDGMAIGRFKAQGMGDAEAEDALTRAKIEEALRTELFLENSGDIANGFSHGQLEEFRKKGIPDFALTKGKQKPGIDGDTIYIDRAHPEESLRELLKVGHARRGKGAEATDNITEDEKRLEELDREGRIAKAELKMLFPAGFPDQEKASFDDIRPEVAVKYAQAVAGIVRTRTGSYCQGRTIHIGNSAWSSHHETYCHEAGHAVFYKWNTEATGETKLTEYRRPDAQKGERGRHARLFLGPKGLQISECLRDDVEKFFDENCGARLKKREWDPKRGGFVERETNRRDWQRLGLDTLMHAIFGERKERGSLTLDEQKLLGAVTDTIQAATNSQFQKGAGHDAGYYSNSSHGAEARINEPFANISALLAQSADTQAAANALGIFPKTSALIAEDFYGIRRSDGETQP